MTLIQGIHTHLENMGKVLDASVRLDEDNDRKIIQIHRINDKTSDELLLFETYFIFEAVEFLENGDLLEDVREELTLQHVRTYMHSMSPYKNFNRSSPKDALYLLETLYAWKDGGVPVPEKYIDLLKIIVSDQKEGEGL